MNTRESNFLDSPLFLCGLYVLLQVPFLDKAVHIDDALFLWSAEHILRAPLDFFGFTVNWYGWEMEMSEVMKNPPLVSYFLALLMALGAKSEVTLHLGMLLPGALAVLGVHRLAGLLCERAWLATLLTILSPIFLVTGTGLMADMFLLALWVWAIYWYLRGERQESVSLRLLGVFLAGGAALCKYNGLAIIPLLLAVSIHRHKGVRRHMVLLLLPVAMVLGLHWYSVTLYGEGLVGSAMSYSLDVGGEHLAGKLLSQGVSALCFMGGGLLGCLLLLPFALSRKGVAAMAVATALVATFLDFRGTFGGADFFSLGGGLRIWVAVQAGILIAAGTQAFVLAGKEARRLDSDVLLLILWLGGQFVFAAFLNWTVNARTMLPLIPPACILLARAVERAEKPLFVWGGGARGRVLVPLVISGIVSLAVAWSDYRWANSGREAVVLLDQAVEQAGRPPESVYFAGHWGFQYYMQRRGFRPLDHHASDLLRGDLLVLPEKLLQRPVALEHFKEAWAFAIPSLPWLSVHRDKELAGFYSIVFGPLPFVCVPTSSNEFSVFLAQRDLHFRPAKD